MKCSIIIGLLLFGGCQGTPSSSQKPIVVAHRGASGYVPEHTLASTVLAHSFDVDYLEADLVMSKDNVLVVMHDHSLNTSTDVATKFPNRQRADGAYYVIDFTLAELKSLVVHERRKDNMIDAVYPDRFPSIDTVSDFRIPTFEEFLIVVQGLNKSRAKDIGVAPEVKEPSFHEREGKDALKAAVDMLTKYGYNTPNSKAMLQAFSYDAVKKARVDLGWKSDLVILICETGGQYLSDDTAEHQWLLTEEGIKDVSQYANWYSPWVRTLYDTDPKTSKITAKTMVQQAHDSGMKIVTWTHRTDSIVAPFKSSDEMLDAVFNTLKVDALFSDQSDKLIEYLERKKMR